MALFSLRSFGSHDSNICMTKDFQTHPLFFLFFLSPSLQRGGVGPLHLASRHGHTHLVRLLLDHGADVNLPSRGGVGPLHLAARFGHSATVELLLDKGNRSGTLVSIFGLYLAVLPTWFVHGHIGFGAFLKLVTDVRV